MDYLGLQNFSSENGMVMLNYILCSQKNAIFFQQITVEFHNCKIFPPQTIYNNGNMYQTKNFAQVLQHQFQWFYFRSHYILKYTTMTDYDCN